MSRLPSQKTITQTACSAEMLLIGFRRGHVLCPAALATLCTASGHRIVGTNGAFAPPVSVVKSGHVRDEFAAEPPWNAAARCPLWEGAACCVRHGNRCSPLPLRTHWPLADAGRPLLCSLLCSAATRSRLRPHSVSRLPYSTVLRTFGSGFAALGPACCSLSSPTEPAREHFNVSNFLNYKCGLLFPADQNPQWQVPRPSFRHWTFRLAGSNPEERCQQSVQRQRFSQLLVWPVDLVDLVLNYWCGLLIYPERRCSPRLIARRAASPSVIA